MNNTVDSIQLLLLPKHQADFSRVTRDEAINDHTASSVNRLSRKAYNQRYYQIHKERIQRKKKKIRRANILQTLGGVSGFGSSTSLVAGSMLRYIELAALVLLIFVMTYFLITEAAGFYLESHESLISAYLKAGMVEGVAVLFSFSKAKTFFLRWSQRLVVVLLCSLTVVTMCGKCFKAAVHDSARSRAMSQVIEELETERSQKETFRQALISRGWIGAARRYERSLDQIRQRLTFARQEASKLETPKVIMNGLVILIVFRLLIVSANLICIHRVAEQLGFDLAQKQAL